MKIKQRYTALYERLSHDDELQGESNSISNQKQLLMEYAVSHQLPEPRHFSDDGISGTRFDRPAFLEMIKEVEEGKIGIVLVKDMSRLGRDYLKVGQIVEMLRQKNVRLIAVNDGTDTLYGDDDFLPFRNIMNEWYAKDTSKKIRSTFKAKGDAGKHVASAPPYGYVKDPLDKNHWIVDEEAAEVIRRIFKLTLEGKGPFQICKILEADHIEIPAEHQKRTGMGLWQNREVVNPYRWNSSTVANILTKKEYLGHTVNFKTRKHFKDKKSHYVPQKYWQIFENTQEPIIDEETFYNAQKCRKGIKRYPNGWGEPHPLDGKMRCFDCGSLMYCHRTSNGKRVAQYICAKYGKQPVGTYCSSGHRVNADAVIEILRDTLRYLKSTIEDDPELFVEQITQVEADNRNAETKKKLDRLNACKKRISELEKLICKIYEDNALGKMPESRYETLISTYSKEQNSLKSECDSLEDDLAEIEANKQNGKHFVNLMSKYNNFDEITPYMVSEFIDRIEVHERDRKGSAQTTQTIDIYFNFIGNYRMPTVEPTPEELAERERMEAIKDKRHQAYLRRKASGWQKRYDKKYGARRKARVMELKAQNPNPYEVPAEEYDKEHYSRVSVVLANSEKPDF
ncbi:MAG: recombinase family protein [Pseudobutyrivibrio sp.]|nr:recombinase family protein [Pseudobutyrivibrio sp.]